MTKRLMVTLTNAAEGRDEEFNDWYDNVHIPDVLTIDGVQSAQRFEVEGDDPAAPHRYLTIYELDREGAAVMGDIIDAMGSGTFTGSESIDGSTAAVSFWRTR